MYIFVYCIRLDTAAPLLKPHVQILTVISSERDFKRVSVMYMTSSAASANPLAYGPFPISKLLAHSPPYPPPRTITARIIQFSPLIVVFFLCDGKSYFILRFSKRTIIIIIFCIFKSKFIICINYVFTSR